LLWLSDDGKSALGQFNLHVSSEYDHDTSCHAHLAVLDDVFQLSGFLIENFSAASSGPTSDALIPAGIGSFKMHRRGMLHNWRSTCTRSM